MIAPFIAVAASGLALRTPAHHRGLTSAVFLFAYNIVGFGGGPTLVAWLAEYMPNRGDLEQALGLSFVALAPVIVGLFLFDAQSSRGGWSDREPGPRERTGSLPLVGSGACNAGACCWLERRAAAFSLLLSMIYII